MPSRASPTSLLALLAGPSLAIASLARLAHADAAGPTAPPGAVERAPGANPVIGGTDAPDGKWPDAAGIYFDDPSGSWIGCSGTLIAPDVVLTAGHCNDPTLNRVLLGSISQSRVGNGEVLDVAERIEYPDSWNHYDVTVLKLASASRFAPRTIATGWARFDIVDGATAALVGFGTVDRNGSQGVDALQEALSVITDSDCTASAGCNAAARPDGELGAGGDGIDTCPGDSGGPLYLVTDYGTFLAGVTSRGYDDNQFACSEGGIYARPDKLVGWIEEQAGVVALPRGPEPSAEVLVAPGGVGAVNVDPGDPRAGTAHVVTVLTQPAHGEATIGDDGEVRYRATGDYVGPDTIVVQVADAADPARALPLTIAVDVLEDTGCGCAAGSPPTGSAAPLALALLALRRRRRRATPGAGAP